MGGLRDPMHATVRAQRWVPGGSSQRYRKRPRQHDAKALLQPNDLPRIAKTLRWQRDA